MTDSSGNAVTFTVDDARIITLAEAKSKEGNRRVSRRYLSRMNAFRRSTERREKKIESEIDEDSAKRGHDDSVAPAAD